MSKPDPAIIWTSGKRTALAVVISIWFAAALFIGANQLLSNTGAALIPPIALSVAIPVAAFLGLYQISGGFRRFVLAQDIKTLTMMQHWRVIGFVFLPLYAYGVLPGLFAWPAGHGDVAIGLAAIVVIVRMNRHPDYVKSREFVRFHLLGLLDFVVALGTSALSSGAIPGLVSDGVTSAPLDVWPLSLFPSFIVPIFIILHLSVLLKVREMRRRETAGMVGGQLRTA